jgi:hypothetical protein
MLKIVVKGALPEMSEEKNNVEPDLWVIDFLKKDFTTDNPILITDTVNGATVIPFITSRRFSRLMIVEQPENIDATFQTIYATLPSNPDIKIVLSDERPTDIDFEFRLTGRRRPYLDPKSSLPHSCGPIYGLDFSDQLKDDACFLRYRSEAESTINCRWPWGQRKESVYLIQFLTRHAHESKYVVYCLGILSTHIESVAKLFPNNHFDIWTEYAVHERILDLPNVTINNYEITNEVIECYRDSRFLFVSDIYRITSTDGKDHNEIDRMRDLSDQARWTKIIGGSACLRFRLPWVTDDEIIVGSPDGELFFQAWGPKNSTEVRLHTDASKKTKSYSCRKMEEMMSYFNKITRNGVFERIDLPLDNICYCHDCTLELNVICEYLQVHKIIPTPHEIMRVSAIITNANAWRIDTNNLTNFRDQVAYLNTIYEKDPNIGPVPEDLLATKRLLVRDNPVPRG